MLAQTCARERALYEAQAPGIAAEADRFLAGYFGAGKRDAILAAYAAASPGLDDTALRVAVMTDERYVTQVGRFADPLAASGGDLGRPGLAAGHLARLGGDL